MAAGVDVALEPSREFKELAKRLKSAQKDVRGELRKAIVTQSRPIVGHLQQAVTAIDSKVDSRGAASSGETARAMHAGSRKIEAKRSHGLRATIARAIQVKVRTNGVQIRVDLARLPVEQRKLPRALDSPKGWWHPVYGHNTRVHQVGASWWSRTIETHHDDVRRAILAAMRTVADKVKNP